MAKPDWKNEIGSCFDDLRILEKCRAEVDAQFAHFYESVAAPAFQGLADEFKHHKVRCSFERAKENRFRFEASFPGRREPQFEYSLWVPYRAVELSLMLTVQGRLSPGGPIKEKTFPFPKNVTSADILKLDRDDLAHDMVKGRAFGSPLARGLYPRARTAEVDPRAKPGAPAAVARYKRFVTEAALAPEGATETP